MNGILESCLAIVASLCLNGEVVLEVETGSHWTGARAKLDGVKIVSTIRTDNFAYPDRRRMSKHCVRGESCIFYYKYCVTRKGRAECSVYYNEAEDDHNRLLQFSADSMSAVSDTLNRLSIVPSLEIGLIPLAALKVQGETEMPPYCRPSRDPDCKWCENGNSN